MDEERKFLGFTIGCDLGQARDFTAIAVLERVKVTTETLAQPGFEQPRYERQERGEQHLRHLQRLPLGTGYPEVVALLCTMMKAFPERPSRADLVVDATGVGRPVVDMIRKAGLRPVAVTITGGFDETSPSSNDWRVPKRNLVSSLAVLLQSGRLKISPQLTEGDNLVRELLNFKVKVSAAGHDSYEAWRESIHDDLVLATAIAAWWADRAHTPMRQIPNTAMMQR
jgi:hypothetical protein